MTQMQSCALVSDLGQSCVGPSHFTKMNHTTVKRITQFFNEPHNLQYEQRKKIATINQKMTTINNNSSDEHDESIILWQKCVSTFRRSAGDLIAGSDPSTQEQQHMELPPILATLDKVSDSPMSIHYFAAHRGNDTYDSDSEVECVAMPTTAVSSSSLVPMVALRRNHRHLTDNATDSYRL